MTRVLKRLATLCTLIWLFICMNTEVLGRVARVVKRLATLCLLIWLFTCLRAEVHDQVTWCMIRLPGWLNDLPHCIL